MVKAEGRATVAKVTDVAGVLNLEAVLEGVAVEPPFRPTPMTKTREALVYSEQAEVAVGVQGLTVAPLKPLVRIYDEEDLAVIGVVIHQVLVVI